tara:strand:+ start:42 stop:1139 length:1098 start_codon:yes stop_codon:yes gene_type:complete
MEAIEQTLSGTVGFGNKLTATISRNGDLVSRMYYQWALTVGTNEDSCANVGSALFREIVLEIGGQQIDKHYGHWLETWAELTEPNESMKVGQKAAAAGNAVNGTLFQNMSGMGGVEGNLDHTGNFTEHYTPLQFWFCRNPGLALPLIALQYHEVKVITTLETGAFVLGANAAPTNAPTVSLWVDYIYLDTDERRRFAQQSHEYLIEQLQFQNSGTSTSHTLNFNHPVKELIWTGGVTNANANDTTSTVGPSTALSIVAGDYKLKLNGHDRFSARPREYFTRTQVWQHHTGPGGMTPDQSAPVLLDSIGVYSFALKPEEHQPSGTCNFSRIDNAILESPNDALYIYAVNYNVLRVMSGMGGLAYSN